MPDELVIIRSFSSEIEANLAVSELEDAGIAACILNTPAGANYPSLELTLGVDVAVRISDVDSARSILDGSATEEETPS
jgi:hypothetical protein